MATVPTQILVSNGTTRPLGDVLTEQSSQLATAISTTSIGAKGDLLVGSGPGAYLVLPIGVDGQVLVADSTQSYGMLWKPFPNTFANGLTVSGGVATFSTGLIVPAGNIITADTITALTNTLALKGVAVNGGVAVALDNTNALASGKLLSIRNAGVEKAWIDVTGGYGAPGGGSLLANALSTYGATSLTLTGNVADSASAVGAIINNSNALTAGTGARLLSFRVAGVEKAYIDPNGSWVGTSSSNVFAGTFLPVGNTPVLLKGTMTDSATSVALRVSNSNALVTAGAKIVSFYNDNLVTEKAFIDKDGNPTFAGGTGTVTATLLAPSGGVARVRGNFLDGATAVGVILDNNATLVTAGSKLVSVRNNTVEKAYFDKDGNIFSGSSFSVLGTQSATIKGQQADAATAISTILDTPVSYVTAGSKLLSVRNNAVEKAYIANDGTVTTFGGVIASANVAGSIFLALGGLPANLEGRVADGATAIANKIANTNALVTSGAKIASFYSDAFTTEVAYVRQDGYLSAPGLLATPNFSLLMRGGAADGATAVGLKIANSSALVTGGSKIVSFYNDNQVTEKAFITKDGSYIGTSNAVVVAAGTYIPAQATPVTIQGSSPDGAAAIGVKVGNTPALATSGSKIVSFFSDNMVTERAYIDRTGGYNAAGGGSINANNFATSGSVSNQMRGAIPDSATAIANKLGNNTALATAGSKIVSFYSDFFTTEKAFVDKDGKGSFTGGVSPGTPAAVAQTGRIFQGSGAPANANGADGDFFFRTDTPGTPSQRLYVRSGGVWTGFDSTAVAEPFTATPRVTKRWVIDGVNATMFTGVGTAAPVKYGTGGAITNAGVGSRDSLQIPFDTVANSVAGITASVTFNHFLTLPKVSTVIHMLQGIVNNGTFFEIGSSRSGAGTGAYTPTLGGTNAEANDFAAIHLDTRVSNNWIVGSGDGATASWVNTGYAATNDDWLLMIEVQSATSIKFTMINLATSTTYTTTKTTNMPSYIRWANPSIGGANWAGGSVNGLLAEYLYMEHN